MNEGGGRSLAHAVGLFIVLVILVNGLVLPGATEPAALIATFYLAFFVHAGFSLHDGAFDRLRTFTWTVLILTWITANLAAIITYTLVRNQTALAPLVLWLRERPALGPSLMLAVLAIDLAALHRRTWRSPSPGRVALFLISIAGAALAFGVAGDALVEHSHAVTARIDLPAVLPEWHQLPYYALLRAVPDKTAAVALMFAAMLLPLLWPWMGADKVRRGPLGGVWPLVCLAQAGVLIGLAVVGTRPPDGAVIAATQGLAVAYFAFFLLSPPVLRALSRRPKAVAEPGVSS